MKFWLITWLVFSCPATLKIPFFGKKTIIPPKLRPIICEAAPKTLLTDSKREAYNKIYEVGCDAKPTLDWCSGMRCYDREIECETVIRVEGEERK